MKQDSGDRLDFRCVPMTPIGTPNLLFGSVIFRCNDIDLDGSAIRTSRALPHGPIQGGKVGCSWVSQVGCSCGKNEESANVVSIVWRGASGRRPGQSS